MVIKRDFRTLAPATQAELRRIAVAMVRAGKTRIEAAETVGVNRRELVEGAHTLVAMGLAVTDAKLLATPGTAEQTGQQGFSRAHGTAAQEPLALALSAISC